MKVTIGIPAVKSTYLEIALQSVVQQSFRDFECIVVNYAFGETEKKKIKSIVDKFKDNRVRYVDDINHTSVVEDWNNVLKLASGSYFSLFSDDDIYDPLFLETMLGLAAKYPRVDVFHCRVKVIDGEGSVLDYTATCPEWEDVYNYLWHRTKMIRNQYIPDFVFKTEALKAAGGFVDFPLAWGSDDATTMLLAKEEGIGYSALPLCSWRYSGVNLSRIGNIEERLKAIWLYDSWLENFMKGLAPATREQNDLFADIRKIKKKRSDKSKSGLLIQSSGSNALARLWIVSLRWVRFRLKYRISFISYIKSLAYSLK